MSTFSLFKAKKKKSLYLINGIGSGKLLHEIHEILKYKKEVKSFVNQYHPNFGHGATEIYFRY
jgi:dsDNA-specific endonuclease/ATPase MutS2